MYGADPRLAPLGTKTGCRRLFAEAGVPHPLGVENLHTVDEIADAVVEHARAAARHATRSSSSSTRASPGEGNALVRPARAARARVRRRSGGGRASALGAHGAGVAETPARGLPREVRASAAASSRSGSPAQEMRSPSVQLRVTPGGAVELLSTHDQLLGGASGQSYLGCTFPADSAYARAITEHAETIGERLAAQGALGRFAVDFVVGARHRRRVDAVRDRAQPAQGRHDPPVPHAAVPHRRPLRPGDGAVPDPARAGEAPRRDRPPRVRPAARADAVADLFDIVARHGLHFDQSRQVGIVFHMISCLTEHGRVGLTAVGDSPEEAESRYRRPNGCFWTRQDGTG